MRAAALDKGRGRADARSAPARGQARARQPAQAPPTKLRAAQSVGLRAPVAAAGAGLLAALVLVAALATGGRAGRLIELGQALAVRSESLALGASAWLGGGVESLGWRVRELHLQGASPAAQAEILAAAAVRPGQSLTSLDLAAVRRRVESVGWVERARVMRLWPDALVVDVDQRPLIALWQRGARTAVIASNGAVVGGVDPGRFPSLPLVVGEGANTAAAAILPLLAQHPRLWSRVLAVVRVDERRWNVRLKDGAAILLPEAGEASALARLDELDQRSHVLDLGLSRIDLRDPEMIVVRSRGASTPPGVGVKSDG